MARDAVDLVNISEENSYSYEVVKHDLKAPIKKGTVAGKVNIYANETKVNEIDLIIDEDINKAGFFTLLRRNLNKLLKGSL